MARHRPQPTEREDFERTWFGYRLTITARHAKSKIRVLRAFTRRGIERQLDRKMRIRDKVMNAVLNNENLNFRTGLAFTEWL